MSLGSHSTFSGSHANKLRWKHHGFSWDTHKHSYEEFWVMTPSCDWTAPPHSHVMAPNINCNNSIVNWFYFCSGVTAVKDGGAEGVKVKLHLNTHVAVMQNPKQIPISAPWALPPAPRSSLPSSFVAATVRSSTQVSPFCDANVHPMLEHDSSHRLHHLLAPRTDKMLWRILILQKYS